MALYTIGEVALLCDINPVTLRAWQRRYGLLKPQRTDGGHRLFNDADIDRIREIKRWIDNGVQVSKVKMLLSNENVDVQNGWRDQQETLLTYLQSGNLHSLRTWIKERGQDYSAVMPPIEYRCKPPVSPTSPPTTGPPSKPPITAPIARVLAIESSMCNPNQVPMMQKMEKTM